MSKGNSKIRGWRVLFWSLLAVLLAASVVACVSLSLFLVRDKNIAQKGQLIISSYTPTTCYNGSGSIVAVLKCNDGTVKSDGIVYTADNDLLSFDSRNNGVFNVNSGSGAAVTVNVTISCAGAAEAVSLPIIIKSTQKYTITLDAVEDWDRQQNISVTAENYICASVDKSGNTVSPNPTEQEIKNMGFNGFEFDGWYKVREDGTLSTVKFNVADRFYYDSDITLCARYKTELILDTDGKGSNDKVEDVYYNEQLKDWQIEKLGVGLDGYSGWEFDGWFENVGGNGVQNGLKDGVFALKNNCVFAKWTADLALDTTFKNVTTAPSTLSVTYHGNVEGLYEPLYNNDGLFVAWYIKDAEKEISNGDVYTYGATNELYAKVKFPVVFDYQNAGESSTGSEDYYIVYGESLTTQNITAPKNLPSPVQTLKSGWYFKGWNTEIGGVGTDFQETTPYDWSIQSGESGILKLYAKRETTFYLYDQLEEDGVTSDGSASSVKFYYNGGLEIPTDKQAENWLFDGYFNVDNGHFEANGNDENKKIVSSAHYTGEGNLRLYAKWTGNIRFDTSEVSPSNTFDIKSQVEIVYNSYIFQTEPLYANNGLFDGWYTQKYGNGSKLNISDADGNPVYYTGASGLTFYHKIQYPLNINYLDATDKNGGEDYYLITYGKNISDSRIILPEPIKTNTEFTGRDWVLTGWYTAESGGEVCPYLTEAYFEPVPLNIYARWKNTITLIREISAAGAMGDSSRSEVTVYYNCPVEFSEPAADGWEFEGWYTQAGGKGVQVDTDDLEHKFNFDGGFNVYAAWSTQLNLERFDVTLKSDIIFNANKKVIYKSEIGTLPQLEFANSEADFLGWFLSLDNKEPVSETDLYSLGNDVTLYAGISFTLNVDYQNATSTNGGVQSYQVIYNAPVKINSGVSVSPRKDGWLFNGYYTQPYGMGKQYDGDTIFETDGNITLYASWRNQITLKPDIEGLEETVLTVVYGQDVDLIRYNYGYMESWKFEGWYIEEHGYGDELNRITKISLLQSNDVDEQESIYNRIIRNRNSLYARWVVEKLNIYPNNGSLNELQIWENVVYGISPEAQGFRFPEFTFAGYDRKNEWTTQNGETIYINTNPLPLQLSSVFAQWEGKNLRISLNPDNGQETAFFIDVKMGQPMPDSVKAPEANGSLNFLGYFYNYKSENEMGIQYYNSRMESTRSWDIWPDGQEQIELKAVWVNQLIVEWRFENGEDSLYTYCSRNTLASIIKQNTEKLQSDPVKPSSAQYSYTFVGWNTEPNATSGIDLTDTWIENSITFYAVYSSEIRTYTVVWKNYDGTNLQTENNVKYGSRLSYSGTPQRNEDDSAAYRFRGWNTKQTATTVLDLNSYTVTGNTILFAQYDTLTKFTLNFSTSKAKITINNVDYTSGSIKVPYTYTVSFTVSYTDNDNRVCTVTKADKGVINPNNGSFVMPDCDVTISASSQNNCVAEGTLITLADGSQVPVEQLKGDEMLLVWDIYTGSFAAAPILFIDSDSRELLEVINLYFSDGSSVKVISEHGFWDYNLNEWIFLRNDATKYIGHWFNKCSELNGELQNVKVQLTDVVLTTETTVAWSPVTFGHLCYYVNGLLSMPGATEGFINIFEVNPDTLKVDEEKMAADIEKYGLFTYDDFADYIPETVFEAFNGQYLKVAMGKGLLTWDGVLALINTYQEFWQSADGIN